MINTIKSNLARISRIFKKSGFYQYLKTIKTIVRLKRFFGGIAANWLLYRFRLHGDFIHLNSLKRIVKDYGVTSIVETGTYRGYTTVLLAKHFPNLKIYSCEINREYYLKAKKNTKSMKNITLYNKSSPEFIEELIKNKLIGDKTLFYLDAHWLDDWPLEKELQIISSKLKSALISIDDFKVDGDRRFKFDEYHGRECALSMVNPNLNKKNKYHLLFPNYGEETLFKKKILHPDLIGYVLIFQNMQKEFQHFKQTDFAKRFFLDKSSSIKPNLKLRE